jgi:hypothetical protein
MTLGFAESGACVVVASRKVGACEAAAVEISLLGCRLLAVGGVDAGTGGDSEGRDSLRFRHAPRPSTGPRPCRLNI